ncbi:MAG: alkylhydroperoxidase-related (seleno)protein, partial [Proteobacteria bacterium]|nr:alkylhydroperoxidase-related (seleno)protein [Pseudomonadota bacterium]
DTLTVAAAFNGITRVADSTGIPLDDNTAEHTGDLRESTGIAQFAYEAKSTRYG